ncbi:MAG: hypothetical protein NVS3B14_09650 [Ktedonobacteraceae bacterium]
MGVLIFILIVALLIIVGVLTSVHLYTEGASGLTTGRFKRIRRVRKVRPAPGGSVIEETEEEIIDEEVPVEEEPSL